MSMETISATRGLQQDEAPFSQTYAWHDQRAGGEADVNLGPFDLTSLWDRCQGNATFSTVILQKFANRAIDQLSAIDRACGSRNADQVEQQARTLELVAGNLSAHELRASAAKLAEEARAADFETLRSLAQRLRVEVVRCLAAVPEAMTHLSGPDRAPGQRPIVVPD